MTEKTFRDMLQANGGLTDEQREFLSKLNPSKKCGRCPLVVRKRDGVIPCYSLLKMDENSDCNNMRSEALRLDDEYREQNMKKEILSQDRFSTVLAVTVATDIERECEKGVRLLCNSHAAALERISELGHDPKKHLTRLLNLEIREKQLEDGWRNAENLWDTEKEQLEEENSKSEEHIAELENKIADMELRLSEVEKDRNRLRELYLESFNEIEEWQNATGLSCGGDTGGVTVKMAEKNRDNQDKKIADLESRFETYEPQPVYTREDAIRQAEEYALEKLRENATVNITDHKTELTVYYSTEGNLG
jgi:hypothetical protein